MGGNVAVAQGATNLLDIKNAKLFPYNQSTAIYSCPSDKLAIQGVAGAKSRVRSYSMNGQMGGDPAIDFVNDSKLAPPRAKSSQIQRPSPSQAMVFVDEQGDRKLDQQNSSIDDGYFAVQAVLVRWHWQNTPASRHGNGGVVSFADGHSELWRWYEAQTQGLKGLDRAPNPRIGNRDLSRFHRATAVLE